MTLAQFAAEARAAIFELLSEGKPPPEGEYSEAVFLEGKAKGKPLMGATRYAPDAVTLEFIYPDPNGAPILLSVKVDTPERIVFLPVPEWVVAQIWEGEVAGSYRFESEAEALLRAFESLLEPGANAALFDAQTVIGKR